MTKEESENKKTPAKEKDAKANVVPTKVPASKTHIATRLEEGLKGAKLVNRSSDLVPLGREFDQMRKQLRSLITATKQYHAARVQVDKARMEVTVQLSELAKKSPLDEHVGKVSGFKSLASVHQLATEKAKVGAEQYQQNIVDYAIEWEQIVTTRVDEDFKKTNALHESLNHYENKIDSLRKKVNGLENKGKESPAKLSEQLTRNEEKLKQAWHLHEESASTLCNLLDEVMKGGWKDLYPLVMAALQWEVDRTTDEHDVFSRLSKVKKGMTSTFDEKASLPVVEQRTEKPSAGSFSAAAAATTAGDIELDATGS